jgi:putative restriction endonuclease
VTSQAFEERARAVCFEELRRRQSLHGEVLPIDMLQQPITVDGESIAIFMLQRGIHKPRQLDGALAVTTTPPKRGGEPPYHDYFEDGFFRYHYRVPRTNSGQARRQAHQDNESVRVAMRRDLPVVYWFGVVEGAYRPFFPAYVVSDDPRRQQFSLDLTELGSRHLDNLAAEAPAREYRAQIVQARMHQARFRQAVLRAYRSCCAICRLCRGELVDAAHILGDADGGEPVVPNGMALCKLHHAAFDRHILGVRPDLTVIIRQDILERGGRSDAAARAPGFHGGELGVLPTRRAERPSTEFLERRWERFLAAG